jgi:hypothetical protein
MDCFGFKYGCSSCEIGTNDLDKLIDGACKKCGALTGKYYNNWKQMRIDNFNAILELIKNQDNKDLLLAWLLSCSMGPNLDTNISSINEILELIRAFNSHSVVAAAAVVADDDMPIDIAP